MRILARDRSIRRGSNERFWRPGYAQNVKKGEVQEALPPAGVIGAAPLTLVPQPFPANQHKDVKHRGRK